jgi:hypothetical protein
MMMCSMPEAIASSTPYCRMGLSTSASISLGMTLVAGKKRVPNPPAGNTALRTGLLIVLFLFRASSNFLRVFRGMIVFAASISVS